VKIALLCPPVADNVLAALRGRGLTKFRAGGALAKSHKGLGGHTPPLSQNRPLGDRPLSIN